MNMFYISYIIRFLSLFLLYFITILCYFKSWYYIYIATSSLYVIEWHAYIISNFFKFFYVTSRKIFCDKLIKKLSDS